VALLPPVVTLDDGGSYRASELQRWIWRQWLSFWAEIEERKREMNCPLHVILNGELADDNYHHTTQLVTRNPADQLKFALLVLAPVMRLLGDGDHLFVLRGTEAHSGVNGSMDETLARELGATPAEPELEVVSHWRLWAEFERVRFDVSHHPPGGNGRRPWTKPNFAATLAAMATWEYMDSKVKRPHLRVYGHVHDAADSYDVHPVRVVINPSWQLTTAYGHRIGGNALPVGGSYVICEKGSYDLHKRLYHWPLKGYWKDVERRGTAEPA
jgi:hypothetical protein